MDFCRNISVSGGLPANFQPEQQLLSPSSCSKLGSLDDLFSGHYMEEGDVNMEWLSIFVEDCLSSSGNCLPPATPLAVIPSSTPQSTTSPPIGTSTTAAAATATEVKKQKPHVDKNSLSLHKFVVPGKARSKRKRSSNKTTQFNFKPTTIPTCWSQQYLTTPDPPLLQQAYWLADSELILPNKGTTPTSTSTSRSRSREVGQQEGYKEMKQEFEEEGQHGQHGQGQGQGRKCSHCLSQRTPQWRAGPLGPKTLCNACGVRYKSGRLLPEYRPAKSPTFVSYKHSNSHKKVLEMRMSLQPSSSSSS